MSLVLQLKLIFTIVISLLLLVGCSDKTALQGQADYERVRSKLSSSLLVKQALDEKVLAEINKIKANWIKTSETPDEIEAAALDQAGLPKTIHGLTELFCLAAPPFSTSDATVNQQWAQFMLIQSLAMPMTVDGTIYFSEEVAMIKTTSRNVKLYEALDNKLVCWMYHKPE